MVDKSKNIRTISHEKCSVCGAKGVRVYDNLTDRLFGVPGKWSLNRCPNKDCGLIWIDPAPVKKDLPRLYANYYTHQKIINKKDTLPRHFFGRMREGYLATKFGYTTLKNDTLSRFFGFLLYLYPSRRAEVDGSIMNLQAKSGGRALEIGFGDGNTLRRLNALGWMTEGVDFDPIACKNLLSQDICVRLGAVKDQKYEDNHFDAIVSNHVIEHVEDPREFVQECYRILKKNGVLIMYTPNSLSFGHMLFKQYWGGLDPPRHLNLFNRSVLVELFTNAKFLDVSCKPCLKGAYTLYLSYLLWRYGNAKPIGFLQNWIVLEIARIIESMVSIIYPSAAEDLIIIAKK